MVALVGQYDDVYLRPCRKPALFDEVGPCLFPYTSSLEGHDPFPTLE
jgi:hypothetical protein